MHSGQLELQSSQWLAGHTSDRPVIDALIERGLGSARRFQVFVMQKGLLGLDLGPEAKGEAKMNGGAFAAAGLLGGAVGGLIAGAVAQSLAGPAERGPRYDMCDDDTLLEMARESRHSFVSLYNDVKYISIDAPGFWASFFGNSATAAWIKLRDRAIGTVWMEIRDPAAVTAAIEALPRRLGDRVRINAVLDRRTMRYRRP